MKSIIIIIMFSLICGEIFSQENYTDIKYSICKIYLIDRNGPLNGKLSSTTDSTITIKIDYYDMYQSQDTSRLRIIPVARIQSIKVRTTGGAANGFIKGSLIGASAGAVIGFSGGDDPPGWFSMTAGEKAGSGAILGFFTGSIIGAATGKRYDKFIIDSSPEKLIQYRNELDKHCMNKIR